ncbi:hypothetical protein ABZ215_24860 [Amycolatopsis sp. NPDC006131]|uniref:hypothetical protein n=1 Tax=Amycolatopsis sp. NPDC006131 TaxID=3156731 RepID=UPI0033A90CA7
MSDTAKDYIEDGEWVSAHRPDRAGAVVLGELLPYDGKQGERVRDEQGQVWCVVADSVRPVPRPDAGAR